MRARARRGSSGEGTRVGGCGFLVKQLVKLLVKLLVKQLVKQLVKLVGSKRFGAGSLEPLPALTFMLAFIHDLM